MKIKKIDIISLLIFMIILFLPFQQAFTLQIGATVRICDILIIITFIMILLAQFINKKKLIYIEPFYLYILINTIIMTLLLNDKIQLGLSTINYSGKYRWIINIATTLIAIFSYSIGVYLSKNRNLTNSILRIWSRILIFISIYVIIQFVFLNIFGFWIHLPGERINENTSYAYGLRRAYGFSIEPGALASFMMFSFLIIYEFTKTSKLKKFSLIFCCMAVVCSMSSIGLITIIVFFVLNIAYKKSIDARKWILLIMFIIFIYFIFNNQYLYKAVINKIGGNNFSKMDRLNNNTICWKMFCKYPILGVGFGNYGALRNLFSYNTLFSYRGFYDMPNSIYSALFAELGIIGVVFFVIFIIKNIKKIKQINNKYLLFIIPFLILIAPSSTITLDYMALGFGIINGVSSK